MNETMRKRYLRALLVVGLGGGAATGTWLGYARTVGADSMPPLGRAEEPTPWVRASAPEPVPFQSPTSAQPIAPVMEEGTTTSAFHAIQPVERMPTALPQVPEIAPVLPPLTVAEAMPAIGSAEPASIPPLPPVMPAVGTASAAGTSEVLTAAGAGAAAPPVPPLPDLPTPGLPGVSPAAPAMPTVPALPVAPVLPLPTPTPIPTAVTPAVPAAPIEREVVSEKVDRTAPITPALPVPPIEVPAPATFTNPIEKPQASPLTEVAPAPQPVKIYSSELPVVPLKTDSRLPDVSTGNTLKQDPQHNPEAVTNPGIGVLPVPSTPILPEKPVADVGVPSVPPFSPVTPVEPPVARPAIPSESVGSKVEETPGATNAHSKSMEPLLPVPAKDVFPSPIMKPDTAEPTSGDGPMTALTRSAAAAVLGGMMIAPVAPETAIAAPAVPITPILPTAVTPVVPIQADDKTDSAEMKKQLEESNLKLSTIQDQLKQLTELLNGKKDEKGFPLPSDPGLVSQMKELRDRLSQIEKDLTNLKSQTSLRPSTGSGNPSGSPIPGATVDPKTGKGTVRVVNEYPVQISIVVNGTSYRIAPSKSLDVDVSAGDFTYQLLESGAAATKSVIKEKETVTLRIK